MTFHMTHPNEGNEQSASIGLLVDDAAPNSVIGRVESLLLFAKIYPFLMKSLNRYLVLLLLGRSGNMVMEIIRASTGGF